MQSFINACAFSFQTRQTLLANGRTFFRSYKTKACSPSYKIAVTQLHTTLMNSFFMLWKTNVESACESLGFWISKKLVFGAEGEEEGGGRVKLQNTIYDDEEKGSKIPFYDRQRLSAKKKSKAKHYLRFPIINVNVYIRRSLQ
jgi:hypothetical protein